MPDDESPGGIAESGWKNTEFQNCGLTLPRGMGEARKALWQPWGQENRAKNQD